MTDKKQKIAVLGGGLSALSTIYYLTNQDGWQDHYDITVYQMGWRLGGKLASGSDAAKNDRIEDTGVHFCMGFYENFFHMIRDCYFKLYGDAEIWRDQFMPYDSIVFMDYYNNQWKPWSLTPPSLHPDKSPGDGLPALDLWEYLLEFIKHLNDHYVDLFAQNIEVNIEAAMPDSFLRGLLLKVVRFLEQVFKGQIGDDGAQSVSPTAKSPHEPHALPDNYFRRSKPTSSDDSIILELKDFINVVKDFIAKAEVDLKKDGTISDDLRHAWILLKFGAVMLHGIIGDEVLFKGFRQLDGQEFSAWLRKWGADDALIASPLIRGLYEGVFAYEDGDTNKPSIAAGVALYTMLRQFLFHNGSLIYRMNDSTGISVFAPIYNELNKRGVKFEFFQRIRSLNLSTDPATPNHVESITIERQVTLLNPPYNPLIKDTDKDEPAYDYWPTVPIFDQIVPDQAKILQTAAQQGADAWAKVNLEYYSSPSLVPEPERTYMLRSKDDFDIVLLALPIGVLPYVCPNFEKVNPKWDGMIRNLKTVSTQGMQLWFLPSLAEMGWAGAEHPIAATYVDPLSAWGDMYQLLTPEEKKLGIQTAIHFAAVLKDLPNQPPPDKLTGQDHIRATNFVRETAVNWLQNEVQPLWPKATDPANPRGVDWSKLYVFHTEWQGSKRFDDQYWGASIDPSIRYDQSLPNTMQHRLKPGDSGFDNVVLAGTWTDNGLNVSLMESATMSGMMAASVISEKVTGTAYPGFDAIAGVMDYNFQ